MVREAQPHLVTVHGEAGIGKSRLVAEFERRALGDALVLHGRCLPYGEAQGYWALAGVLREAAGVTPEVSIASARAQLDQLVAGLLDGGPGGDGDHRPAWRETAGYLALLSGLDAEADRAAARPDQRTLHAALRRFLESLARRRPLCLLLEDLHWADAALLDLLESVAARAVEAPLLLVAQARPELLERRPAWGRGVRAFTSLALEPLDARAGRALLLALCREHGLPERVAEEVGAAAGGNPLFAEELVATVAEGGAGWHAGRRSRPLSRPASTRLPPEERGALRLARRVREDLLARRPARGRRRPGRRRPPGGAGAQAPGSASSPGRSSGTSANTPSSTTSSARWRTSLLPRGGAAAAARARRGLDRAPGGRARRTSTSRRWRTTACRPTGRSRAIDYLGRAAARAGRAAAHREETALLAQAIQLAERLGQGEVVAELHARRGKAFWSVGQWRDAEERAPGRARRRPAPTSRERQAEAHVDLSWAAAHASDTPSRASPRDRRPRAGDGHGTARSHHPRHGVLGLSDSADGDLDGAMTASGRRDRTGQGPGAPPAAPGTHLAQPDALLDRPAPTRRPSAGARPCRRRGA